MNSYPRKHHRRSIRLKGYDYSLAGGYFITISTQNRLTLFGTVAAGQMRLTDAGEMIQSVWKAIPARFPTVELGEFVVMPDHFHAIVSMRDARVPAGLVPAPTVPVPFGATTRVARTESPMLGDIVGAFKSITTVEYIRGVKTLNWPPFHKRLWERNYYEHIIRSDAEHGRIALYIDANPRRWTEKAKNRDR